MAAYEVLLLDNGSPLFYTLAWALESKGYGVAAVSSPEVAIESLARKNYDLFVATLTQESPEALEVVKRARKLNPEIRVIILGGDNQVAFPLEAYRLKIDDYVLMPCSPVELWRRVARCLGSLEEAKPAQSDSQVRLAAINERVLNKLAIMFHDIRGAMVTTSAALQLLLRGSHGYMDAEASQKVQELHSRVKKIVGLSEEYMAHFLGGNKDVTLNSELVDLREEIVAPILEEFSEEIRDHGITIDNRLQTMSAATIPIKGSKLYLKSVFRNLFGNGIKYGGDGCTITIDLEERGANCCLKVRNSGGQVFEENQPLLFPGSRQVIKGDGARGLGLGLRLVKDIIKEQGGDIWYEPRGDGSNFVISLPQC
ncbi:MAG: hybrid sensor histidine kinase/response regulator [Syntrophales bacterium]|nr:hybrid sensor histidine kinase/response regulator [Syntrophales bacterium]MDD5641944.1 hybrid sensor histidine kinase/response regulator [Syntrophales bacterium]